MIYSVYPNFISCLEEIEIESGSPLGGVDGLSFESLLAPLRFAPIDVDD